MYIEFNDEEQEACLTTTSLKPVKDLNSNLSPIVPPKIQLRSSVGASPSVST